MKLIQKIAYAKLARHDCEVNGRTYICPDGVKVPSVTTILDSTKPAEAKKALEDWKRFTGQKKADQIRDDAAFRGTLMHKYLEKYVETQTPNSKPGNYFHLQAWKMSNIIIENFLKPFVSETWGLETNLWYPELYAGTTDMVGVYQGVPSIIDFKQTNKRKDDSRVEDYKFQLAAYINAHNEIYKTDINQGVILMCSVDLSPQSWVISGEEMTYYKNLWWQRVGDFYKI